MNASATKDPLHGVTLEEIINSLLTHYGWDGLGRRIDIDCFHSNPSVKSSLKFLRRTPWARKKVENLYLDLKMDERLATEKGSSQHGAAGS